MSRVVPAGVPVRPARWMIATIATGTVLNPLDATMIAVALPRLRDYFAVSLTSVAWLVSGFFVAGAVGQALMGRLTDRLGARRTFRAGLGTVAVCCALAPLSPSVGWLVGIRIVQALGTSAAFPAGLALIRRHLTGPDGRPPSAAMGVVTTANTLSAAVGPFAGGLLVSWAGWQAIFLANVPVALLAVLLAGRWLPADPRLPARQRPRAVLAGLDLPGVALYSLTLVAVLVALLRLGTGVALVAVLAVLPCLLLFGWWERRSREPFLDLGLLAQRPGLLVVFAQYGLANVAYYGLLYAVPLWLQGVHGASPATAGLLLVPVAAVSALVTPLAARWITGRGPRPTLLTASLGLAAGGALMLSLTGSTPLVVVAVVSALVGMVNNPNTLGLQAVLYTQTPAEQTGTVSGVFQSFRYVGSILATALLALAFDQHADDGSLHLVAGLLLGIGALLTVLNLTAHRQPAARSR